MAVAPERQPRHLGVLTPADVPVQGGTTQLLVDFLASVWADEDEEAACRDAVERVALALRADVVALVCAGRVAATAGRLADAAAAADLIAIADGRTGILKLTEADVLQAASAALDEEPGQHDRLRALGCPLGQGFYFQRPVKTERIQALLDGGPLP